MAYVLSAVTTLPGEGGNDAGCSSSVRHQYLALGRRLGQAQIEEEERPHALVVGGNQRLVLASPPEAHEARLRNPLVETRGAIVLVRRGTCSFVEKARRALKAGAAAVVIGNNDKAHPYAVFAMPGAWDDFTKEEQQYPVLMVSFACFEQLCALVRLEADFATTTTTAATTPMLQASLAPLRDGTELQKWELGPAIRALILCNDHQMLHSILQHVDATYGCNQNENENDDENNTTTLLLPYNEAEPETSNTPLHLAVEQDAYQCLAHLLQCHSISRSLDQPRLDSFRPTHLAARHNHLDICLSLLLCAGAYIDAPHRLGWTPLHFAAQSGCLQTLQMLIQADATLDTRALDGSTPLLIAVLSGQAPVVAALLTAGANLYLPNNQGKLPADYAGIGQDARTKGCLQVIQQHQEQDDTAGTLDSHTSSTPVDHLYHWAAAPWLSVSRSAPAPKAFGSASSSSSSSSSSSFSSSSVSKRKAPSPLPPEAPVLEVVSFLDHKNYNNNNNERRSTITRTRTSSSSSSSSTNSSSSSKNDLPICRAVLPWAAVHAALHATRRRHKSSSSSSSSSSRGREEEMDLQEELAAFLAAVDEDEAEDEEEVNATDYHDTVSEEAEAEGAGQRLLGLIAQGMRTMRTRMSQTAAPAWGSDNSSSSNSSSSSSSLPRLAERGRLVALELPASFRGDLWMSILSPSAAAGGAAGGAAAGGGKGYIREEDIKPMHSAKIESRIQCLYEDIRRTKFGEYAQGEGMERLRRLILAWLHLREDNGYRQGLTSLASVFLEVFPSRRGRRGGGWDGVADRRALVCLSRVVSVHMEGLFTHGSSLERLQDRVRYLESMLLYWDPLLALHLAGMEVPGELFCTPWLVTLYADVLPMEEVVAVLDVLLTLGPSFCLCFAAAIVLQRRDLILATTNQTTLLLTFSKLNSEVQPIDVPTCLDRAFHLYAKTPGGLLRPWDQQQQQQQEGRPPLSNKASSPLQDQASSSSSSSSLSSSSVPVWKEKKKSHSAYSANGSDQENKENKENSNGSNGGNGGNSSKALPRRASFISLPHVLDHVARLSTQDLEELEEAFRVEEEEEEEEEGTKDNTDKEKEEEEERKKRGVVLLDIREMTMDEYYGPKPLRGVPAGIRRVRLPFSSVRGHVDFCRPLRSVQKEMRPPAALRPLIGRAHIVVHGGGGGGGGREGGGGGGERRAEDVARMLVLCKVPLVSVFVGDE